MARHEIAHRRDARQKAAGEDVALNEIDAFAVAAVALVLNGDRLNRHFAAGAQPRLAGAKEFRQEGFADRFDHLDRHQLVVFPG
ncbi:hypothetical protein D3C76_1693240 [compost metagenome]